MSDQAPGVKRPSPKPVTLTFYDYLKYHPYTSTFHVREETPDEQVNRLISVVRTLSKCVLGKYTIGYMQYVVPDFSEQLKSVEPHVMGTEKWVIKYHVEYGSARSVTIPGRKHDYTMAGQYGSGLKERARLPYAEHPVWQEFLAIFRAIGISRDGQAILEPVTLDSSNSKWPPKGWKKR